MAERIMLITFGILGLQQNEPTNQDTGVGSVILKNRSERIKKPACEFLVIDHVSGQDEVAFGDFLAQLLPPTIYPEEVYLLHFDIALGTNFSICFKVVTNRVQNLAPIHICAKSY